MRGAFSRITAAALMALSISGTRPGYARPLPDDKSASDTAQVKIDNFSFAPATLTISTGTTVTWVNQDDIPHTIVGSETKALKSPPLDTDQKFSYRFTKAGTYEYFCGIHPKMTGKIVVR